MLFFRHPRGPQRGCLRRGKGTTSKVMVLNSTRGLSGGGGGGGVGYVACFSASTGEAGDRCKARRMCGATRGRQCGCSRGGIVVKAETSPATKLARRGQGTQGAAEQAAVKCCPYPSGCGLCHVVSC